MKTLFFLLLTINLSPVIGQDFFKVLSSKTWFEENGWAGVTLVFVQSDSGQLKGFRQVNGSGLPVVATEILDVIIRQDTIFLSRPQKEQRENTTEKLIYTYSDSQGLLKNGTSLRVTQNEPIVYLSTAKDKFSRTSVNAHTITKYDFDKNLVYVNEKVFIIDSSRK